MNLFKYARHVENPRRRLTWLVWVPLTLAAVWSVVLVVGAGTVDVYSGVEVGPGGAVDTGATVVDENGSWGWIVASVPLGATVAVAALAAYRHLATAIVAAGVVGVLGLLNLLAMLSIGIFVLPTTAALVVAVAAMLARATLPPRSHAIATSVGR